MVIKMAGMRLGEFEQDGSMLVRTLSTGPPAVQRPVRSSIHVGHIKAGVRQENDQRWSGTIEQGKT